MYTLSFINYVTFCKHLTAFDVDEKHDMALAIQLSSNHVEIEIVVKNSCCYLVLVCRMFQGLECLQNVPSI